VKTRCPTQHVLISLHIWPDIHDRHRSVAFAIEILVIKKVSFLIPTSRNIQFRIGEIVRDKMKWTIMSSKRQVRASI